MSRQEEILAHELGHALIAIKLGYNVKNILVENNTGVINIDTKLIIIGDSLVLNNET